MKKIILIYGLIAGTIMGGMFFATIPFWRNGTIDFNNGMVVGYTTMVIALSLVFFGVKSYRDQHLGGVITFGKAFKVGILITLVASVIYCLAWELCYSAVFTDFGEKMMAQYFEEAKRRAVTEAEKDQAIETMEMYKNPLVRFAFTSIEVLPVGLIITLLSATLLRRKEVLPDE